MEDKDFIELVKLMRERQREYFRTRNRTVLEESRRLEKAVDKELRRREPVYKSKSDIN